MTKSLPEILKAARKKLKLSLRDVAQLSDGQISASGLSRIERGDTGQVSGPVLEALSEALGVPLSRLRTAQGQTSRMPAQPFVLPPRASDLNLRERKLVMQLVDTLRAAHRR